jgi:lysophospholipase L1-like esterase
MRSSESQRHPRALFALLALLIAFVSSAAVIEIGGHIYAYLRPSYWGLFFKPDRVLGWKLVPNLRWNSTGTYWYAREFSVPIQVNSEGFRDLDREFEKPRDVVRVALLGDSLVEAIQVPFHQTAGQVLEARLNAPVEGQRDASTRRYEVLNFGISNYSVGQYLLTWEKYVSRYQPDYVVILVAALQMNRTVYPYHKRLRVRPIFRIQNDTLIRVPPKDYDALVKRQERTIGTVLDGKRIGRAEHRFFIGSLIAQFRGGHGARMGVAKNPRAFRVKEKAFEVNLRVIEELGASAGKQGAQLIIADAFLYFNSATEEESTKLRDFCVAKGFGYVPLSRYLQAAIDAGISPRWKYDAHFNRAGNEMFAESLSQWIAARDRPGPAGGSDPSAPSSAKQP